MSVPSFDKFMDWVVDNNPGETVFHQAAREVFENVWPVMVDETHPAYNPLFCQKSIAHRLAMPEKVINFQVVWENEN